MKRGCIAIVDAAHARLYTYDPNAEPPALREVRDLVNAGRQAHGMFADIPHARGHGTVDDHRTDHIAELEARFARNVIAELDRVVREQAFAHVIIVASARMLGTLRDEYAPLVRSAVTIDEIPQDLAWLTTSQLHDHLASMHLIGPRARAPLARARPR
jgi:protein required for attachment to host cells